MRVNRSHTNVLHGKLFSAAVYGVYSDYDQMQYRPIILQYSEILQYHYLFILNSRLWNTDSRNVTIHAWTLLRQNIQRNDKLRQ